MDDPAFKIGYYVGIVIGLGIVLGALGFSVFAIIKAFTRRTTGWIVTASICGGGLLLFGSLTILGFINGFTKARQAARQGDGGASAAPASSTAQTIQGLDVPYKVVLPPGWTAKRTVNDFDVLASHRSLYFGVIAEEGALGTSETIVNFAQNKLRSSASELQIGETSTVKIDGHDWLTFSAKCQVQKIPFAYHYSIYAGPEGSFQILSWTLQSLYDRDVGAMRDLAATFRFPPSPGAAKAGDPTPAATPPPAAPQVLVGESVSYKLTVPGDWSVERKAGAFDVETSHRGAYVGIVAEEGSLGTPQVALKIVQDNLRQKATGLQMGQAYAVRIDGRDWLQFTAKCQMKDVPLAYHYFVYAGPEGSFRIVGWTLQNVYDRYADQIRDVAMTFQFPPPAATPAPTAAAAPTETPAPTPTTAPKPAKPTPRTSRPKGR